MQTPDLRLAVASGQVRFRSVACVLGALAFSLSCQCLLGTRFATGSSGLVSAASLAPHRSSQLSRTRSMGSHHHHRHSMSLRDHIDQSSREPRARRLHCRFSYCSPLSRNSKKQPESALQPLLTPEKPSQHKAAAADLRPHARVARAAAAASASSAAPAYRPR